MADAPADRTLVDFCGGLEVKIPLNNDLMFFGDEDKFIGDLYDCALSVLMEDVAKDTHPGGQEEQDHQDSKNHNNPDGSQGS